MSKAKKALRLAKATGIVLKHDTVDPIVSKLDRSISRRLALAVGVPLAIRASGLYQGPPGIVDAANIVTGYFIGKGLDDSRWDVSYRGESPKLGAYLGATLPLVYGGMKFAIDGSISPQIFPEATAVTIGSYFLGRYGGIGLLIAEALRDEVPKATRQVTSKFVNKVMAEYESLEAKGR